MKKLELIQMENLEAMKGGFLTSFSCAMGVFGAIGLTAATGGLAAPIAAGAGALACGYSVGHGLDTGNWW
ncbi:hypothetical protein [Flavobacterium sp. 245]|uniref:hypothetical protein n=1 Tax=Flavobacterium sp. 245 TaxID=2512115 RepID=UPI00105C520B|nr:hypothetical protein [Flavobacterium sp. 245]TDO96094.1 hypothetical protein EV145_11267 [Flavobacterium sp. 245]